MATAAERRADREVTRQHEFASRQPDPVAFLRARQAEAEARYAQHGGADLLALVRAYDRSLDGGARA